MKPRVKEGAPACALPAGRYPPVCLDVPSPQLLLLTRDVASAARMFIRAGLQINVILYLFFIRNDLWALCEYQLLAHL